VNRFIATIKTNTPARKPSLEETGTEAGSPKKKKIKKTGSFK
jgi:hypothetical protein